MPCRKTPPTCPRRQTTLFAARLLAVLALACGGTQESGMGGAGGAPTPDGDEDYTYGDPAPPGDCSSCRAVHETMPCARESVVGPCGRGPLAVGSCQYYQRCDATCCTAPAATPDERGAGGPGEPESSFATPP